MRVGVNTGAVVVGDARAGGSRATGDAVNVAARLQQAAEPGETLVGDSTWRLVRDAVTTGEPREVQVKGRDEPVVVRRLVAVDQAAEAIHRRVGGPMVGRDRELGILRAAFERAVVEERCVLVTVLGSAGVGKSRLVHEFLAGVSARTPTVLRGRCLPYGQGITWYPVAELLRSAVGLDERPNRPTCSSACADASPAIEDADADPRAAGRAARHRDRARADRGTLLGGPPVPRAAGDDGPVVVVLDDLQWAEPDAPRSRRASRGVGPRRPAAPARDGAARAPRPPRRLGRRQAGRDDLPARTAPDGRHRAPRRGAAARAPTITGGSPGRASPPPPTATRSTSSRSSRCSLDDGLVQRRAGRLAGRSATSRRSRSRRRSRRSSRPASTGLSDGERRTIERASVVGKEFGQRDVSELTPAEGRAGVPGQLMGLVRKELIRPDRRPDSSGETYRFRHLLDPRRRVRQPAEAGAGRAPRAVRRLARADRRRPARRAGRDRRVPPRPGADLPAGARARGRADAGPALRAGRRLAAAGRRAAEREEGPSRPSAVVAGRGSARRRPRRSIRRAHPSDRCRLEFRPQREHGVGRVGGYGRDGARRRAGPSSGLWLSATRGYVDPTFLLTDIEDEVEAAARDFEAAGEVDALLEATLVECLIHLNSAHWAETAKAARRGLDLATTYGRERRQEDFADWLTNALCWGQTRRDGGHRDHRGDAPVGATPAHAGLDACRPSPSCARSSAMVRARGQGSWRLRRSGMSSASARMISVTRGRNCVLDDLDGALLLAQAQSDDFERRGETGQRSTMVALIAWIFVLQGRDADGDLAAEESRRLGVPGRRGDTDAVARLQVHRSGAERRHRGSRPDQPASASRSLTAPIRWTPGRRGWLGPKYSASPGAARRQQMPHAERETSM